MTKMHSYSAPRIGQWFLVQVKEGRGGWLGVLAFRPGFKSSKGDLSARLGYNLKERRWAWSYELRFAQGAGLDLEALEIMILSHEPPELTS